MPVTKKIKLMSPAMVTIAVRVTVGLLGCGFIGWVAAEAVNNRANDAATNVRVDGLQKQIDDAKDHPLAPKWLIDKVTNLENRPR